MSLDYSNPYASPQAASAPRKPTPVGCLCRTLPAWLTFYWGAKTTMAAAFLFLVMARQIVRQHQILKTTPPTLLVVHIFCGGCSLLAASFCWNRGRYLLGALATALGLLLFAATALLH